MDDVCVKEKPLEIEIFISYDPIKCDPGVYIPGYSTGIIISNGNNTIIGKKIWKKSIHKSIKLANKWSKKFKKMGLYAIIYINGEI